MIITEKIYDVKTGETNIIDREATADEIALHQAAKAESEAIIKAAQEKEAARQAVLDKLGLTADEVAALLG
jgi:hypothetical protein